MLEPEPLAAVRPRAPAACRPDTDPACAGCALMGLFRALRRAGLAVQGGPGCDPEAGRTFHPEPGRWAAVAGRRDAAAALPLAIRAGARVLAVADRLRPDDRRGERVVEALRREGIAAVALDPSDLAAAEAAIAAAAERSAAALAFVALARCVRRPRSARRARPGLRAAPRSPPVAVDAARCNGCGACLALGCPAIADDGGAAMVVDPDVCAGCGLCAPLCRPGAIVPLR